MKSPQQSIFDAIFKTSLALGYATYPFLPAKDAKIPFVYVGEQYDRDMTTKSTIYGRVQQTIHIYHDYTKRGELTAMMDALKREIRKLRRAEGFYISVKRINAQTLLDTSTVQTMYHGVIEIDIQFN